MRIELKKIGEDLLLKPGDIVMWGDIPCLVSYNIYNIEYPFVLTDMKEGYVIDHYKECQDIVLDATGRIIKNKDIRIIEE